jgi:hypothetical protein
MSRLDELRKSLPTLDALAVSRESRSEHVEAPWKRQTAAEGSTYMGIHCSPSGLSDRRQ